MELSPAAGGGSPARENPPAIEYSALVVSPIVNGDARVSVSGSGLMVSALFETVEIPFSEINSIGTADYTITADTDSGKYSLSRMGNHCRAFHDSLCDAYNRAVLRSLFIVDKPIITAKGDFAFSEEHTGASSTAAIHVYSNSAAALPPDLFARRVPLCFVTGMEKEDFKVTLRLDTNESYSFAKLGYDTSPFADAVEKQIRKLREESLAAVRDIDNTLTTVQCSQLAKLMPRGAAAPLGLLSGIAPTFISALEEKIAGTRAAEPYKVYKELSEPSDIWLGFRINESDRPKEENERNSGDGSGPALFIPGLQLQSQSGGAATDPYLIWMIIPSPDGLSAAVEFAQAGSATFVFRTGGDFPVFARKLNRALEAIGFKREVIRLSDDELRKPENADYYMAAKRTAALQFVRSNFTGRVIHSGVDSWKRKLVELWDEKK